MGVIEHELDEEKAKIRQSYSKTYRGGLFTPRTRQRLIGEAKTERSTKTDFSYDVRERVKNGLADLTLFMKFAESKDIEQTITAERLKPLIESLFETRYPVKRRSDTRTIAIANLLVQLGFYHLYMVKRHDMTQAHKRTIREALDLANYLFQSFLAEKDRDYAYTSLGDYNIT
jgi:hypothetical protein